MTSAAPLGAFSPSPRATIAKSDTGQSRRVADFLLAWWNGGDLGHFPIEHLWNVDRAISADMVTIMAYLAEQPCAVYANAFGFDGEMSGLVQAWRPAIVEA